MLLHKGGYKMDKLQELWERQIRYNKKIRNMEHPDNKEYWTKQYILGVVSEVDEILQEINWKIHRRGHTTDRYNLARELADVTKYVWCLWELHGFSSTEMLAFVEEKSLELEALHKQEFEYKPDVSVPIIITDIDGTIGDWRKAFIEWMVKQGKYPGEIPGDPSSGLAMEIDLKMPYPEYAALKEQFEAEGGYKLMKPYPDAVRCLQQANQSGVGIIAYTARPANRYSRIWADTWHWLQEYKIPVDELHIGSEERILRACQLQACGNEVRMLEDNPAIAIRAAVAGIEVFLRNQPYNVGVSHNRIIRVDKFTYKHKKEEK